MSPLGVYCERVLILFLLCPPSCPRSPDSQARPALLHLHMAPGSENSPCSLLPHAPLCRISFLWLSLTQIPSLLHHFSCLGSPFTFFFTWPVGRTNQPRAKQMPHASILPSQNISSFRAILSFPHKLEISSLAIQVPLTQLTSSPLRPG